MAVTQCLISPLDDGAASTYNCELAGVARLIDGRYVTCLFSWLVNDLATEVRRQISGRGRTD
jgi:hypothetical protein